MRRTGFTKSGTKRISAKISKRGLGFTPARIWSPVPGENSRSRPYSVPQEIRIGTQDTSTACAKLTPGPFAVGLEGGSQKAVAALRADRSWHIWNTVTFDAGAGGLKVHIDLEGHNEPESLLSHVDVCVVNGRDDETLPGLVRQTLKKTYPNSYAKENSTRIPDWWKKPIYCGWGDQVATSLLMEGPGPECRALAYCTQGLYQRWIDILDDAKVPFGTIIIDAGWSPGGVWKPNPIQWPDLRGFIKEQHKKGRKVLLWIPTWFCEGLPEKWCIFTGKTKLVTDPTNKQYRSFLKDQVYRLLSSGEDGFDADGFKVDQLQYTPNEYNLRGGQHFGRSFNLGKDHPPIDFNRRKWGCELLYQLQKDIYDSAKNAKPDSLITSSTVHPYFYDTFDMVRLHDTGFVKKDVLSAMKPRADLSKMVFPEKLIDADNWIHHDYAKWLDYTLESYKLGIPCIFYSDNFVNSFQRKPLTQKIKKGDLRRIGKLWQKYIAG